ncbi:4606_t:CDS:2, partial [Racocetra fulgida]
LPFIGPVAELIAHWLRHQGQVKEFSQENTNIPDNEWFGFIDNEFKTLISSPLIVYDEFHERNPDMRSLIAVIKEIDELNNKPFFYLQHP